MAPLADTVGLVDGQQADIGSLQQPHKPRTEALGCHVDQLVLTRQHALNAGVTLFTGERRVDGGRGDALGVE